MGAQKLLSGHDASASLRHPHMAPRRCVLPQVVSAEMLVNLSHSRNALSDALHRQSGTHYRNHCSQ